MAEKRDEKKFIWVQSNNLTQHIASRFTARHTAPDFHFFREVWITLYFIIEKQSRFTSQVFFFGLLVFFMQ